MATGSNMSQRSLTGLHVLITRPSAQAKPWALQLEELGAKTSSQTMLEICPLISSEAKQSAKNTVMRLDEYQKVIFVSQNAVDFGVSEIDTYWPQLPADLSFFAVGSSTANLLADKLSELGGSINFPEQAMNSEALLALPALQKVLEGEKILIVRGRGGRTHLGDSLEARGALVDYCEIYERRAPETVDTKALATFKNTVLTPIVSVHSGETLNNLCDAIATHTSQETLRWLQGTPLLLPGARVAQIAKDLAFTHTIVAENATNESMIEALYDWRYE